MRSFHLMTPLLTANCSQYHLQLPENLSMQSALFYMGSGVLHFEDLFELDSEVQLNTDRCNLLSLAPIGYSTIDYPLQADLGEEIGSRFVSEISASYCFLVFWEAARINIITFSASDDQVKQLRTIVDTVSDELSRSRKVTLSAILFQDSVPLKDIIKQFHIMDTAWHYYHFISEKPVVLQIDTSFQPIQDIDAKARSFIVRIMDCIIADQPQGFTSLSKEIVRTITMLNCPSVSQAIFDTCLFIKQLEASLIQRGILISYTAAADLHRYADSIRNVDTEHELQIFLENNMLAYYQLAVRQKQGSLARLCRNVIDYIETNLSDSNLSPDTISMQFGMSKIVLSRKFKTETGCSLPVYIHKLRVAKAKDLLKSGIYSVESAGKAVGYFSAATMYRAFLKYEGVSPNVFKRAQNPLAANREDASDIQTV